jgi:hypothetical protein
MPTLKIEPSPYLETALDEMAKLMGRSRTAALENLLFSFETLARHGKLPAEFGLAWIEIATLVNGRGLGTKHADPVAETGEQIDIDVSLLEQGGKAKTGFVGVHATTGNSFRALVPDVEAGVGSRYLPSRKTAVLAAIDRYKFYEQHGLPYGNIGQQVEHYKKVRPEWTLEQTLVELYNMGLDGSSKTVKYPFTLEQAAHVLKAYRDKNGTKFLTKDEQPEPAPLVHVQRPGTSTTAPKKPEPVVEAPKADKPIVKCAVCDEILDGTEPYGLYGKDEFAHTGCQ